MRSESEARRRRLCMTAAGAMAAFASMLLGPPPAAHARDDTYACLETFSGPLFRIRGDMGYGSFERISYDPETRFDARGASWTAFLSVAGGFDQVRNCYAVELGDDWRGCFQQTPGRFDLWDDAANPRQPAPPVCWAGGLIRGTQSRDLSWRDVKRSQGMAITLSSEHGIVDGVRIHNHQDAVVPLVSRSFEVRNSWISNNRDDAIENDGFASGVIEDNLVEHTHMFVSMRNTGPANPPVADGPEGLLEITNNVVRLGALNEAGQLCCSKGEFFKTSDARAPALTLHGNLFMLPELEYVGLNTRPAEIKSCSNNLIVYAGERAPDVPRADCFSFTRDVSMYERARRNWIDCHPEVMRLPGDPKSTPENCDPGFWGGGGGAG